MLAIKSKNFLVVSFQVMREALMNDGHLGAERGNTFQRFPHPYTVYTSWSQAAGRGADDVTAAEIMRDFPCVEDVIHSTEGMALIANSLLCPPPIDDDFLDFNVACSYSEGTYCVIVILSHCKINHNEGENLFLNESIFFTASTLRFCNFADTKMIIKQADVDKDTTLLPHQGAVASATFFIFWIFLYLIIIYIRQGIYV